MDSQRHGHGGGNGEDRLAVGKRNHEQSDCQDDAQDPCRPLDQAHALSGRQTCENDEDSDHRQVGEAIECVGELLLGNGARRALHQLPRESGKECRGEIVGNNAREHGTPYERFLVGAPGHQAEGKRHEDCCRSHSIGHCGDSRCGDTESHDTQQQPHDQGHNDGDGQRPHQIAGAQLKHASQTVCARQYRHGDQRTAETKPLQRNLADKIETKDQQELRTQEGNRGKPKDPWLSMFLYQPEHVPTHLGGADGKHEPKSQRSHRSQTLGHMGGHAPCSTQSDITGPEGRLHPTQEVGEDAMARRQRQRQGPSKQQDRDNRCQRSHPSQGSEKNGKQQHTYGHQHRAGLVQEQSVIGPLARQVEEPGVTESDEILPNGSHLLPVAPDQAQGRPDDNQGPHCEHPLDVLLLQKAIEEPYQPVYL